MPRHEKHNRPDLTIVGGQPEKRRAPGRVKVPVGLEKILYHAAGNAGFKQRLLKDRESAIAEIGVRLRPSEQAMFSVASREMLESMIGHIDPSSHGRRKFMGMVAAAAASLSSGTVTEACAPADHRPDTEMDAGTPSDTEMNTETWPAPTGSRPDMMPDPPVPIYDPSVDSGRQDLETVDAATVDAGTVDSGGQAGIDADIENPGPESGVDADTVDADTVDADTVDAAAVDADTVDAEQTDAPVIRGIQPQ